METPTSRHDTQEEETPWYSDLPWIRKCWVCGGRGCGVCEGMGTMGLSGSSTIDIDLALAWQSFIAFEYELRENRFETPESIDAILELGLLADRYLKEWGVDRSQSPSHEEALFRRAIIGLEWLVNQQASRYNHRQGSLILEVPKRQASDG